MTSLYYTLQFFFHLADHTKLQIQFNFSGAKTSAFLLYSSTKGKAEDAVKELEFSRTSVYRPGLLITEREQPRMMQGMGKQNA